MARRAGAAMQPQAALGLLLLLQGAAALYSSSSPVLQLEPGNFRSKLKAAGAAVVEFYAPWCGHCKVLQPEWEKLAKGLKGLVTVAAVDADAHKDLAQEFNIRGFPTIKFMYMDGEKIKSADYPGQRNAKDILPWVVDKAKSLASKRMGEKASGSGGSSGGSKGSKSSGGGSAGAGGSEDGGFYTGTDVVTLTDSNFSDEVTGSSDLWLVEFYAPWCGHCKNLKPAWIEAATDLKGKMKLGAVDCTVHQSTCSEFGVQGYPTIKYFGKRKSSPEDYNGPRESPGIVTWATEKWAKQAPPPEVRELVDASVWEKACVGDDEGKGGASLCLVAFLPDILDSKASGRKGYISVLQKVADKYKDRPYSYLWAQGGAQAGLEANLGVGGFGYPALVAFKPKDNKFITARGAFETQHVVDFIEGLKHGREPVQAVQGTLAEIKTLAPWDGKDAVVQLEDEFSLDDLNEL